MSVPLEFLYEADDDIYWTHQWYERKAAGLGESFLENLRKQLDVISDTPKLYGVYRGKMRTAPVKRFPYFIYYVDRRTSVLIVAVAHGRRSKRAWKGRGF